MPTVDQLVSEDISYKSFQMKIANHKIDFQIEKIENLRKDILRHNLSPTDRKAAILQLMEKVNPKKFEFYIGHSDCFSNYSRTKQVFQDVFGKYLNQYKQWMNHLTKLKRDKRLLYQKTYQSKLRETQPFIKMKSVVLGKELQLTLTQKMNVQHMHNVDHAALTLTVDGQAKKEIACPSVLDRHIILFAYSFYDPMNTLVVCRDKAGSDRMQRHFSEFQMSQEIDSDDIYKYLTITTEKKLERNPIMLENCNRVIAINASTYDDVKRHLSRRNEQSQTPKSLWCML